MPNYATAYDVMMCEPPDNSIEEAAFDRLRDDTFAEYLEDGSLPGSKDPSHVDELLLEEMPEALDGLITAEDDEALLAVAKEIRDERIKIIEAIIKDNLEA